MSVTTESFVATNTTETQSVCTADSNDIRCAESENPKVILTIPENVDGKVLEGSVLANIMKSLSKEHLQSMLGLSLCHR